MNLLEHFLLLFFKGSKKEKLGYSYEHWVSQHMEMQYIIILIWD